MRFTYKQTKIYKNTQDIPQNEITFHYYILQIKDRTQGHICDESHKTGTSDIFSKISFWYHCKEHTFNFNLIPNQFHTLPTI